MSEIAARLARDLPAGDVIPLSEVARRIGWTRSDVMFAMRAGAITPLDIPPSGRRGWQVSRQEALDILAAAALAIALGIAVVTVLRAAKSGAVDVRPLLPGNIP